MKKKFLISLLTVIILVLSVVACKTENKEPAQPSDKRYAELTQMIAVADEGIFYIGKDNLVHFCSADSGEDMIFCTELNCMHLPASDTNPDPECRAALFTGKTKIAYYEGAIYYFVENDLFEHSLYKMDINGAGRELIATLPFTYSVSYGAVFNGDYLYYPANEVEIDEETLKVTRHERVVEVNIKDGSYRFITEADREAKQYIDGLNVMGNTLYLCRRVRIAETGTYRAYQTMIDLTTLEIVWKQSLEVTPDKKYYCGAFDEDSYYYATNTEPLMIGIYNPVTEEDTVLVEIGGGKTFYGLLCASNKGIVYALSDNATGEVERYYYDVEADFIREFKAEYDKNMTFYDGFRQICVYSILGEENIITGRRAVRLENALEE